jgi:hypothetical protein
VSRELPDLIHRILPGRVLNSQQGRGHENWRATNHPYQKK